MQNEFVKKFLRTILISACTMLLPELAAHAHDYTVHIDASLERMTVEARFDTPVTRIRARSQTADDYLESATDCDSGAKIRASQRELRLPSGGIRCLRYRVDLKDAARDERRNSSSSSDSLIVSPAAWFWRPRIAGDDEIRVRFESEAPVRVSVPWLPVEDEPDTYVLTASPESARAPAVFGKFSYAETEVAGATLRITMLGEPADSDALVDWVAATANNVSLAYGRFPNPMPAVVLIPVGSRSWNERPVPFGRVIRDGGETIELFIDESRSIDEFYDDWTATHEFSHLMLPYVSSRHRWVSEGFATYYQNVLLARAGQYSEQRAWQRLYEGFERGRNSMPSQSPNETAANRSRGGTMKIYWSGAAIAMMADVELRRRSNGRETLDDALQQLASCCLPSDRSWSGPELFQALDQFVETPVFMPLYRRYANSSGFPNYRETFASLGVDISSGRVRLDDAAELAELRQEITSVPVRQ